MATGAMVSAVRNQPHKPGRMDSSVDDTAVPTHVKSIPATAAGWARRGSRTSHDGLPALAPSFTMPSNGSKDWGNLHAKTGRSNFPSANYASARERRRGDEPPREGWRCCPSFIDGGGLENLPESSRRLQVYNILDSMTVKVLMAVIIVCNSAQVIYECDQSQLCHIENQQSACDRIDGWLYQLNWTYLAIYSCELMFRIYVDRMRFFSDRWDIFDFFIVVVGAFSQVMGSELPSTGILRLFRLARLAKAFRWVKLPPELHIMVHGLLTAAKAIFMGTGLIAVMLTLWSVVAVELLNGKNHEQELIDFYLHVGCERCPRAWDSVWDATLSFLQTTLMGDSWGTLALPMIERHWWTVFVFVGVPFSIVLGLTNLILAVIVDKALQQHSEDEASYAQARQKEMMIARANFVELCKIMDADGSGFLSLEEFLNGYTNEQAFRDQLTVMGIQDHELEKLFHVIDKDRSGDVSYEEFAQQLATIKNQDLHAMSSFIKAQIMELSLELADMKEALVPRQDIERMRVHRAPAAGSGKTRRASIAVGPPSFQEIDQTPSNAQASQQERHTEITSSEPSVAPRSAGEAAHLDYMDELRRMTEEVRQQAEYQLSQGYKQRDWANEVIERLSRRVLNGDLTDSGAYGTGTGSTVPMGSGPIREASPPVRATTPISVAGKEQNGEVLNPQNFASTRSDSGNLTKPSIPNEGSVISCQDSNGASPFQGSNSRRRLRAAAMRPPPTAQRMQDEIRVNLRNLEGQVSILARQMSDIQASKTGDGAKQNLALMHLDQKVSVLIRHHGCDLEGLDASNSHDDERPAWRQGSGFDSLASRDNRQSTDLEKQLVMASAQGGGTAIAEKPNLNRVNMTL